MDVSEIYPTKGNLLNTQTTKDQKLFNKPLKIVTAEAETIGEDEKIVLTFEGTENKLALNKTNAMILVEGLGGNTTDWINKEITLIETKRQYQGQLVPAIQVAVTGGK